MRFACFLARTVVHTLDVFALLENTPPALFKLWRRYYHLEPWGDEWLQAGTIAAAAHNAGIIAADRMKDEYVQVQQPADFIPTHKPKQTQQERPDDTQAILAAKYGPKA